MFLKLLKKEIKSNTKVYIFICLIPITLALMFGICLQLDYSSPAFTLLPLWFLSIFISVVFLFILIYQSINKRLFDDGGYLTLTMPVKTSHIITSKITSGIILSLMFVVSTYLSIFIVIIMIPDIMAIIDTIIEILSAFNVIIDISILDILLYALNNLLSIIYSMAIMLLILTFISIYKMSPKALLFIVFYISYLILSSLIFANIPSELIIKIIECVLTVFYIYISYVLIEKKLDI
ncbi:MAG: hypothetical protein R3Y05_00615 [bacterium]